jgi:hypothetical protein
VHGVFALYPGERVGVNEGGPSAEQVRVAAIRTEVVEIQDWFMGMAVDTRDLRDLVNATVARIVFGSLEIEVTPGKVVQERGRKDVVIIDADDVAVVWNARVVGIDNGRKSALGVGQGSSIMICTENVILFAEVLIAARIPLVRIGV